MDPSGGPRPPSWTQFCPPRPPRCQTGAAAGLRRGMLAADGGVLERRPVPATSARHRAAQPAEHHGASVRLGAERQQPGRLQLKTLPKN